jgi:hypothetical protein
MYQLFSHFNVKRNRNIIKMIKSKSFRRAGHIARMETQMGYKILVGNPEGKSPLGRP